MSGIYVHIPFCKTHCTYCAFYSELLRDPHSSELFVDSLIREINVESNCTAPREFDSPLTLYLGGGTPSVLSIPQLQRITAALHHSFNLHNLQEFTIEVNPDDILHNGEAYLQALRELGVNRVSMGIQSFDDSVLRRMGRRHSAAQATQAYEMLRDAGFKNISIDLIFGFTSEIDMDAVRRELLSLSCLPQHISCYQLSIEEGSGLDKMAGRGLYTMPSDEQCERQYYAMCDLLREMGYEHYEISNWAMPGYRSKHNSAYWRHVPYLGFGPGAHSLLIAQDGTFTRRWNDTDLSLYIQAARNNDWAELRDSEILTEKQIAEERLFLGLRTLEGVDGKCIPENKWFISDSIIVDML